MEHTCEDVSDWEGGGGLGGSDRSRFGHLVFRTRNEYFHKVLVDKYLRQLPREWVDFKK